MAGKGQAACQAGNRRSAGPKAGARSPAAPTNRHASPKTPRRGRAARPPPREGETEAERGFGSTLGAGWDIRLSRKLSLTPNADFLFQAFDAGENLQSTNTLLLLTVGLTFH